MNTNEKFTRIPGIFYLLTILFGIPAQVIRSQLIVLGDAGITAANIMSSVWLFRIGFMSDLCMMTFYLLSAWALYGVFKPIKKGPAQLFLLFTVVSVSIMCINMLNQFAGLLLINGTDYLKVFNAEQLKALALFFFNLHKYGYLIAQIFFGLWLFPLGLVVLKSGYIPKYFGVMLIAATFGPLIECFTIFLFPNLVVITYPGLIVAMLGEFSFCFRLLFKGVKVPQTGGI